jgi:hypothetical protein
VSQNFVTSQCIVVSFGTSLSGYALLNASRTAANELEWSEGNGQLQALAGRALHI